MTRVLFVRVGLFASLGALVCACVASMALTQGQVNSESQQQQAQSKPMFVTLPPRYLENLRAPATSTIPNWTGSLSAGGSSFMMVGTDPSSTDVTTTVTAYLVPISFVFSPNPGGIFDPRHVLPNGRTVTQNVALSPIFNSGIDFVQGGTDLGNTQYIDAFQRGSFWGFVSRNTNYHVLLNLAVLPEQTILVPSANGSIGMKFGVRVGLVDINFF